MLMGIEVKPMTATRSKQLYVLHKARSERLSDPFAFFVYRPISFIVTPAFLALGWSATAVTVGGMVLAAAMPLVAFFGPAHAYVLIALMSVCWMVLDCVDGNIARVTNSASLVGQYVDSIGGRLHYLCLNMAIAIMAAGETTALAPGYWLCLALAATLLRVWSRESRADFKLRLGDGSYSFAGRAGGGWRNALVSISKLAPIALLVLGPLGYTHLILVVFVLVDIGLFAYTQKKILAQLGRAGHAVRPEPTVPPE